MTILVSHTTTFRVRYAETDAQGVAHHSAYIVWFEAGRTELLRSRGISYRELEALGYDIVVADLSVRYLAPARFDDLVRLETSLVELRSRARTFSYAIQLDGGPLLATGRTAHLVLQRATGRPVRLPADLATMVGITSET